MADEVKQVKVDNWGIYFLQRLKHFFNRTDYCDLTLQFQDNAQLKVHRLVLSACTEYFELLERTCEMYEDCLVMPEDLQADIVVPIVNFMYTGQLEFRMELLERLHQCSEIMNMPVLSKLLDSHRPKVQKITQSYTPVKKVIKSFESVKEVVKSISATEIVTTTPLTYKRSRNKAFGEKTTIYRDKKVYLPLNKPSHSNNGVRSYREPSPIPLDQRFNKKVVPGDPRPTRYELPEELDTDNIFESSFCNISYTSQPLMVHPETRKQYAKRPKLSDEASTSKKTGVTTVDIVPFKKSVKAQEDPLFEDTILPDEQDLYTEQFTNNKPGSSRDTSQLFDQMLEDTKVTIQSKNVKRAGNLDHAKIISEVLKKYPHLAKTNKNIKLKILNTVNKNVKKQKPSQVVLPKPIKTEKDVEYTFETDVLDSMQAAKLIAKGAENIDGPWICLICGTPGKAMNFTSYYNFRRHLVEVHNEKPVLNICEHCGQRSTKRNYLLHHMYTKHGVEPPPLYRFPKCNQCSYIALTDALLVKHKLSHNANKKFRCNVCPAAFSSSNSLLAHIKHTGHKYALENRSNFQCIYCQKVFLRETNLYAHIKIHHRNEALNDGVIEESDEENEKKTNFQCIYCQKVFLREPNLVTHLKVYHRPEALQDGVIDDSEEEMQEEKKNIVKSEPVINEFQEMDIQYQIQQRPDGNITVVTKAAPEPSTSSKQTILNAGLTSQALTHKNKLPKKSHTLNTTQRQYSQDVNLTTTDDTLEEMVMIDNIEYIMRNNQLVPRRTKSISEEYILSDQNLQEVEPTTSMEYATIHNTNVPENIQHANMILKNSENLAEPIPIYVSNEEEYKALMAGNQPIIFDSGDSNKTLTVLTAPHASSLDTTHTIDLGSTQANDMMIIQDNYPLSVSQTASENSNIVVVYSQPVDGQNKQYQLLTTQDLGAQFVQTSSIITQNFETITTTAPVVNTYALEKQEQGVWHNSLGQIVNTDHIEITPIPASQPEPTSQIQEPNNDVCDLPEVKLACSTSTTENNMDVASESQEDMVVKDVNMTSNSDKITEIESGENAQTMSIMEISELPVEHSIEETVNSNEAVNTIQNPMESEVETKATVTEDSEIMESQTYTQPDIESQPDHIETCGDSNDNTEQQQSEEVINDNEITAQVENIQDNNEEQLGPIMDVGEVTNPEQMLVDNVAEKPLNQNPEWEETIQEVQEDIPAEIVSQNENCAQVPDQQENMDQCEMEESIENIQQEVEKQMAETITTDQEQEIVDEVSEAANSSQDESDYVQENHIEPAIDPVVAQEKISSLLNDWEDNDSQENDSVDETVPEETVENPPESSVEPENPKPDKQEKIKSLVSDWDDEDEENKD